ncbi:MAG: hypothetical protein F6K48_02960 [Okeania sp. SIO3H1]|nr:hypothetical protein [Okeania sp. SIO3H1]
MSNNKIPNKIKIGNSFRPTRNSLGKLIGPTRESVINFWEWFGESKTVDAKGRPLVLYHGTDKDFLVFDVNKSQQDFGIFFTTDKKYAAGYANSFQQGKNDNAKVIEAYVKTDNPKFEIMKPFEWATAHKGNYKKLLKGSDSLVVGISSYDYKKDPSSMENAEEVVVFTPYQVKSATHNSGKFSPKRPTYRNPKVIRTTPAEMRQASKMLKQTRAEIKRRKEEEEKHLKAIQNTMFWVHKKHFTLAQIRKLLKDKQHDIMRSSIRVVKNPPKVLSLPISQLYTNPNKAYETAQDVAEGRLSYQGKDPIIVSRMGRGKYLLMDGHHRALEARLRGDKKINAVVNVHMPTAYQWLSTTKKFINLLEE